MGADPDGGRKEFIHTCFSFSQKSTRDSWLTHSNVDSWQHRFYDFVVFPEKSDGNWHQAVWILGTHSPKTAASGAAVIVLVLGVRNSNVWAQPPARQELCGNELLFPVLLDWNLCCDLIETLLAKRLDTSCLLVKSSTKSLGDFALGDNFRELSSLSSPTSDSDVWVSAMTVRWFRNDLRSVRFRQRDRLRDGNILLVQDSLKLRFIEDLPVNSIFSLPENLFLLCGTLPCEVKCPYLDLSDLLRIKHAHSDRVGPLVRQMSPRPKSSRYSWQ